MELTKLVEKINNGEYTEKLKRFYGDARADTIKERYLKALDGFKNLYGSRDIEIISVPGRSEILGNHTDHNHGRVLAASINLLHIPLTIAEELYISSLTGRRFSAFVISTSLGLNPSLCILTWDFLPPGTRLFDTTAITSKFIDAAKTLP